MAANGLWGMGYFVCGVTECPVDRTGHQKRN